MATRSTIALEFNDGSVQQIYCHWDGYIDHNGRILSEHYSNPDKLGELMLLGDLSTLGEEIGEKHPFSPVGVMESNEYERLYGKMCTAYGRDRGETGTAARKFDNFKMYKMEAQFEEYNYILRTDGKWYCNGRELVIKEAA